MKLQEIFNLNNPVRVIIGNPLWKGEVINGLYEWDNGCHVITVDYGIPFGTEQFANIVAHEYIHAWQCEMGLKLSHGKVFKWWAEKLAKYGYQVSKRQ